MSFQIGLFGFGCVGQGLHHTLNNSTGYSTTIKQIVVKHKEVQRPLPLSFFEFDKSVILDDESIHVVVELISDANEAFSIVSTALKNKKHVVTANKKMLALHLQSLLDLAKENEVSLLYEAAACGSIPIIRTLEEYFDNEEIVKVSGVFNGTSNFILTKTIQDGLSYGEALVLAQQLGFAEADPTNDVEGLDALYKTVIIALHAFGVVLNPSDIFCFGISSVQKGDIQFAEKNGYKIKLVPQLIKVEDNKLVAFVIPKMVSDKSHLFNVNNEFNGVVVEGKFSGEQFFLGRGAGSLPTGAAVLSDVSALSHGYKYEYKKRHQAKLLDPTTNYIIKVYLSHSDVKMIESVDFLSLSEEGMYEDLHYKVGEVQLSSLIEKGLNTKEGFFIAQID